MATFKPDYKAGDGYAPVCAVIRNDSRRTVLYNLRGVMDAHGAPMREYGYQTSLLSTYQKAREGHTPSAIKAGGAAFSTSFYAVVFKLAFHTAVGAYRRLKAAGSTGRTDLTGAVTNLRAGAVPPGGVLHVELGSIPVDGRLNNKGWVSNNDTARFVGSSIGPSHLQGEALDAALEVNADEALETARKAGVGLHFWGAKTSFWRSVFARDLFNANVNFRSIPNGAPLKELEDTEGMHRVQVGDLSYQIDGAGFSPASLDFIRIVIADS